MRIRLNQFLMGLVLAASIGLPCAQADDTDIFLGPSNVGSVDANTNVLFILDNSDSMRKFVNDEKGNRTSVRRFDALTEAFSRVVNNIENVNVGVMRLDDGASILYPVVPIDQQVQTDFLTTTANITQGMNDAVEISKSGEVVADSNDLTLGFIQYSGTNLIERRAAIVNQEDDREEDKSGNAIDGYRFDMSDNQTNGLRYMNLNIPRNATIVDARLQFYTPLEYQASDDVFVQIRGHNRDNPGTFTGKKNDVKNRWDKQSTTANVDWVIAKGEAWHVAEIHESPNLAPIVQELVSRIDWDPNDAMVFLVKNLSNNQGPEGTLYRNDIPSTQGLRDDDPATHQLKGQNTQLKITYTTAGSTQVTATQVGLRFSDVYLPRKAHIQSAWLEMESAKNNGVHDNLALKIDIEASVNPAPFIEMTSGVSGRSLLPVASVVWQPDQGWTEASIQQSADISPLLQAMVNQPTWCGNNPLALRIQPTSSSPQGSRVIFTKDEGSSKQVRLVVNYVPAAATDRSAGCVNEIINATAQQPNGDAAREQNNAVLTGDLTLVDGNWYGLRFQLPVEKNATIQEASLLLKADYPGGDTNQSASFDIWGEASTNASLFKLSDPNNLSNRPRTAAHVTWQTDGWKDKNAYQSPSLTAILQEIVNTSGWKPGSYVSLLLKSKASLPSAVVGSATIPPRMAKADPLSGPVLNLKVAFGGAPASMGQRQILPAHNHLENLVRNTNYMLGTPLVDALYEASNYFAGKPVYFGRNRINHKNTVNPADDVPEAEFRVSHPASYTTGANHQLPPGCTADNMGAPECATEAIADSPVPMYKSPIVSKCQANHIVLLTDGAAALKNNAMDEVQALIGKKSCQSVALNTETGVNGSINKYELCGRDLVQWMANNNVNPAIPGSKITTHTIAFNLDSKDAVSFLKQIASLGNGKYYSADSADELTDTFNTILGEVINSDTTFTAAGATVNQFNRLTNRNELYFSVFKPAATSRWSGNLKRYQLGADKSDSDEIKVLDALGHNAVDEGTGFFKKTSQSFWSSSPDRDQVVLGGAAYQLPDPKSRNVFTYLTGASAPSNQLSASVNQLSKANPDIILEDLNANDINERNQLLDWIRGYDVFDENNDGSTTDTRHHIGDPLHSSPTLVTYGGTEKNPDTTIFFGTNEGFLHAINSKTGEEQFAYMPQSLLAQIKPQVANTLTDPHLYGMDGSPIIWRQDNDQDNQINNSDFVYLYMGMGRGGRDYHALNVTNRTSPSILWNAANQIKGGSGDFINLGQTWSKPIKTRVRIGSTKPKNVLLFAGGFDPAVDASPNARLETSMGNAIYMVDAETGERLWMASKTVAAGDGLSLPDMKYAIPSNLELLDVDQDGLTDQIYVGDLGGQIWRFDIVHGSSAGTLVKGGVIAKLADNNGVDAGNRQFYFKPDVSYIARDGELDIALSIGSGSIAEPLEKSVENRFYVLLLPNARKIPNYTSLVPVTEADLADRTDKLDAFSLTGAKGWYIRMEELGQKVLAPSLTVNHRVVFTTYTPSLSASECSAATGSGKYFVANLFDGNPVDDLNNDGVIDKTDRFKKLNSPSILSQPKLLFPEGSDKPLLMIGLSNVDSSVLGVNRDWQRSYWYKL